MIIDVRELEDLLLARQGIRNLREFKGFAARWFGPTCKRLEVIGEGGVEYNDEYYYEAESSNRHVIGFNGNNEILSPKVFIADHDGVRENPWDEGLYDSDVGQLVEDAEYESSVQQAWVIAKSELNKGYAYWGAKENPYERYLGECTIPAAD